jgi:hypothetical protein
MRVRASERGFFGRLIEAGDEFEVPDGTECSWFKSVDAKKPAKPKAKEVEQAQEDLGESPV